MDLASNSKHMSVPMSASFGENVHAEHPGSSSKQLLGGITKVALSTPANPTSNINNNLNLSGLSSLTHANLFARQAENHLAGQAVTENITPKKTTTGINNLSSSNNNNNNPTTNSNTACNTNKSNNGENIAGSATINSSSSNGVRYKECLKNHAANMGGYAVDGCGEFMPSGEEGSLEALKCAACGCHRNFHRREVNGNNTSGNNMSLLALPSTLNTSNTSTSNSEYGEGDHNHVSGIAGSSAAPGAATGFGGHYNSGGHMGTLLPHLHHHHHHQYMHAWMGGKLMAGSGAGHHAGMHVHRGGVGGGHTSGGQYPYMGIGPGHMGGEGAGGAGGGKRFRTKFTMEQREKMFEFSEKVGWRIHKHDEAAVQQFCAETGVKRHVLKVWMHNNKNTFGKKLLRFPEAFNALPESSS